MNIKERIKTLDEIARLKEKSMAQSRQRSFNNEGFETYTNKLFKPLVEEGQRSSSQIQGTLSANKEAVVEGQQKINEGIKQLGQLQIALAEKRGELPEPTEVEEEEEEGAVGPKIEDITSNVLINEAIKLFINNPDKGSNTQIVTSRDEKDVFYIGKNAGKLTIVGNDLHLDKNNKTYPITEGLVRLLFSDGTKENYSDATTYKNIDGQNYADIIAYSNIGQLQSNFGKSNKAQILQQYLKPYRKGGPLEIKTTGRGIKKSVQNRNKGIGLIVATSPDELIDQLQLLLASIDAGNTSTTTHNKVVAIANYLFDKGHINKSTYVSTINELDRI